MIDIKTDRITIRKFVFNDWKDLQEIIIDKESSEYAIYDHQFPTSDSEVQKIANWFAEGDNFFAVCEMCANKVIGYVCLNGENKNEKDIGYCFHSKYHGKGFATEACIAVINYAFNTLNVERLTSGTANLNFPSCRLLNKLGFCKTDESVESFRKTAEGNPIEFIGSLFLLEKDEWMKKAYSCKKEE